MPSYLGQNFLTDLGYLGKIVNVISNLLKETQAKTILEIGPGKGALTQHLAVLESKLICIEKDKKMQGYLTPLLEQHANMFVCFQDVLLREELDSISQESLVVGNLPYYITSPIIRKFFANQNLQLFGGVFLIQKEVAERLVSSAKKKSFLWWLINYSFTVELCFLVPPEAFTPSPKVTSAVIRLLPKPSSQIPTFSYDIMFEFLDLYSSFKRKTLGASHKILNKHGRKTGKYSPFFIEKYSGKRLEELQRDDLKQIVDTRQ